MGWIYLFTPQFQRCNHIINRISNISNTGIWYHTIPQHSFSNGTAMEAREWEGRLSTRAHLARQKALHLNPWRSRFLCTGWYGLGHFRVFHWNTIVNPWRKADWLVDTTWYHVVYELPINIAPWPHHGGPRYNWKLPQLIWTCIQELATSRAASVCERGP